MIAVEAGEGGDRAMAKQAKSSTKARRHPTAPDTGVSARRTGYRSSGREQAASSAPRPAGELAR